MLVIILRIPKKNKTTTTKKKQPNKIHDNKEGELRNILMYIKGLAYRFSDVLRLHHIPPLLEEKAGWIEFPVLFLLH